MSTMSSTSTPFKLFCKGKVPYTDGLVHKEKLSQFLTIVTCFITLFFSSCQTNPAAHFIEDLQAFVLKVDTQAKTNNAVDWAALEAEFSSYQTDFQKHLNVMSPEQKLTAEALFKQYQHILTNYRVRKAREKVVEAIDQFYEWFHSTIDR